MMPHPTSPAGGCGGLPQPRRPFGEITNIQPSGDKTPQKLDLSPAKEDATLTPLANLKMLTRVAAVASNKTDLTSNSSRRELFKSGAIAPSQVASPAGGLSEDEDLDDDEEDNDDDDDYVGVKVARGHRPPKGSSNGSSSTLLCRWATMPEISHQVKNNAPVLGWASSSSSSSSALPSAGHLRRCASGGDLEDWAFQESPDASFDSGIASVVLGHHHQPNNHHRQQQQQQQPGLMRDLMSAPSPSPSSSLSCQGLGLKVSRKQKSLGLLCARFISMFPESVPEGQRCEIPLDDLAKKMATERRRIYDIVNVLESVQMMTKTGKNLYNWHGKTYIKITLAWLMDLGRKLGLTERYQEARSAPSEDSESFGNFVQCLRNSPISSSSKHLMLSPFSPSAYSSTTGASSSSPASSFGTASPSPSPVERKTSLGVACQKFLMLFLIAPEPKAKINLEFAAKVIHGPNLPEAVMKTRIRRLYDIANILQSLELIQKVQVTESHGARKPAFEYSGPDVKDLEVTEDVIKSLPAARQRNSLLAVGKNLLHFPDDEPSGASSSSSINNSPVFGGASAANRSFGIAISPLCGGGVNSSSREDLSTLLAAKKIEPRTDEAAASENSSTTTTPSLTLSLEVKKPSFDFWKPFKKRMLHDTTVAVVASTSGASHLISPPTQADKRIRVDDNEEEVNDENTEPNCLGSRSPGASSRPTGPREGHQGGHHHTVHHHHILHHQSFNRLPRSPGRLLDIRRRISPMLYAATGMSGLQNAQAGISPTHLNPQRAASPSSPGAQYSLLRRNHNSPLNLSMDRRNVHIISPLALTTHNRARIGVTTTTFKVRPPSHIIPPSPTNLGPSGLYQKRSSPSYGGLSQGSSRCRSFVARSPIAPGGQIQPQQPQQSPVFQMKTPSPRYYTTSSPLAASAKLQDAIRQQPSPASFRFMQIKQSPDGGIKGVGLIGASGNKTVIAVVPGSSSSSSAAASSASSSGSNSPIVARRLLTGGHQLGPRNLSDFKVPSPGPAAVALNMVKQRHHQQL